MNVLSVVWTGYMSEDEIPFWIEILSKELLDDSAVFTGLVFDTETYWLFKGLINRRYTGALIPWIIEDSDNWWCYCIGICENGWGWCSADIAGGEGRGIVDVNMESGSRGLLPGVIIGTGEGQDQF